MTGKRGKIARIIALILAAVMIIFSLPLIALSTKAADGSDYAAQHRLGSWWWWPEDGYNETECEKYLSLYQESGINEIYFYGYSSLYTAENRAKIHTFVQKAMAHGCRVAIMYDGWADLKGGDTSYLTDTVKNGFLAYKEEYPKDAVYGMHFDMEPQGGYVDQTFVDYFIAPLQELREAGIWCEVDVNVNWEKRGGAKLTYEGVTGLFNILSKYTDTMSLMSYRTKADKVLSCGEECLDAAIKYGCPITYGLETDNSGEDGVDFHTSTKEKLFAVIDEVFELLEDENLKIPYGMAIHQNRSFYKLAGNVPERTTHGSIDENTTTTTYIRTSGEEQTTTQISYELVETELYRRMSMDEYFDTTSNGVAFKITELSEALAADYEKNGPIDPDQGEYYQVMMMGVAMMPDNFYPCLIDSRGRDIWADKKDYPNGTVVQNFFVGFPPQIIANIRKPIDFTRNGSEDNPGAKTNTLFLACDRGQNSLSVRGIWVKVFRNPNKVTPTATEPSETEPTTPPAVLLGDANSDGVVNMKDVLVLRKFMADIEVTIDMLAADVTQDGLVNLKDVLQLRKYIAGLIEAL